MNNTCTGLRSFSRCQAGNSTTSRCGDKLSSALGRFPGIFHTRRTELQDGCVSSRQKNIGSLMIRGWSVGWFILAICREFWCSEFV